MSVIAKAIADRQSEIERLQVEIKALNEVDKIRPPAGEARGSALLLAADGGCGHPGRGDPARRQADEEAPTDDGRREECGVRADESLLGRAQKESREVARRGRDEYVPRPRSVYPSDRRSSEVVPATRRVEPSVQGLVARAGGADAPSAPGRHNSPHPIASPAQARQSASLATTKRGSRWVWFICLRVPSPQ